MSDRTTRRIYAGAVLGGTAAGGLVLLAASRTWASVEIALPGMVADTVTVTGTSAVPLVTAMAFVVMAGSVAVVASGGWFRGAIGAVVLLAGGVAAVAAVMGGGAVDDALRDEVGASVSMTAGPERQDELVDQAEATPWRWVAVGGALAGTGVGGLVVAQGRRWPRMGRRYEAPGASRPEPPAVPPEEREVADLWKALDEGEDPTA